ncbi:cytochrome b561 [Yersinia pseudotuberculosis]|uniref:cytochrome b561 n=1 Tax=Yersinia pseudotuberculosis TaxID=633 RepID=UPI00050C3BF4|nr:cytochrome b561 [Yersinia pseudotuberculosis]AJJ70741.1 prokaryotic cytochrome b561 family protein [Yersinia pseudotuberculosis]PSH17300.1 cytochrome B [Yersinia pseudotuberculosis]PSH35704.1 cytochrome B [Yersinia pseudotuberculosis]PSH49309.1 cytochrome B [Yersinia pseudotuberculosis]CNK67782.1 cytochrome b561 [Yersinia pseudotuberculosis]
MHKKYSCLQIGIHWLVLLLVIIAWSSMELRGFAPRSYQPWMKMIHFSCGIAILVLMMTRILIRLRYPTPPIVPKPSPMIVGLAHVGHWVIYLLFIALPIIGIAILYCRGSSWIAFGLIMPHAEQANFDLADTLKAYHLFLANMSYFVIGLHALAALLHHYVLKDNTLLRMMPKKRG